MRESNHLPWMGRIMATAIMVLVGLGVFAGSVAAQTVVYDYDDYRAWWDSFDCDEMKTLLPQMTSGARNADETDDEHEDRVCSMSSGIAPEDLIILRTFIEDNTMNGPYKDNEAWWGANGTDEGNTRNVRQALAGRIAISNVSGTFELAAAEDDENDYSDDYDRLRSTPMARIAKSGNALSGQSGMMTEEDAPALPLAGIGLLGLLLAGRGAWLRRRNA